MAEGVVDGDEEPGIAPLRHDRLGETRGQRVAVINPGGFIRRAGLAGKGGAADRARNGDAVFLGGELLDRKRHRRIVEADRHVDLADLEPLAGNRGADIGLVLMIGEHDLDRLAEHRAAGILDRHARGDHRARAAQIGIETGLIVEHADPDDIVGDLRVRGGYAGNSGKARGSQH